MSKPDINLHREIHHRFLGTAPVSSPLGRLLVAGELRDGVGVVPYGQLRRYGSHALCVVTAGSGTYRDEQGNVSDIGAGHVISVFPELAHWYGPDTDDRWDEWYVTFEGAGVDLLRAAGVFDPAHPVARPTTAWLASITALVGPRAQRSCAETPAASPTARVAALLGLLGDLATHRVPTDSTAERSPGWLGAARLLLDGELDQRRTVADVAHAVHVHPDTLRRAFRGVFGESPGRYRSRRRVEAAEQLLRFSPQLTNREIAVMLGFGDEFHFSHRFRQLTGRSPRAARTAAGTAPDRRI